VHDTAARGSRPAERSAEGDRLPVVTPRTVWPCCTEYVSISQAMVFSSVPMSGAGMSRSGPMSGLISLV
jgi:hypothetical protein